MTTPGLPSLDTSEEETPQQGFLANAPKGKGLTPAGQLAMDPKQTAELLANMEQMVNERTGAFNTFLGGLKDASAWGSGGIEGPSRALAAREEAKAKEFNDVYNMRTQMASYRAAQAQQEKFNEQQSKRFGGAGAGAGAGAGVGAGTMINGVMVDPETAAALSRTRNDEEFNKVFNDWASKRAQSRGGFMYNPESYQDKIYKNIDGKLVPINAIQAKQMQESGQGDLIVRPNQQAPETQAYSGDVVSSVKKGIFGQESLGGKMDTSKPNYAGAVGPMQIKQGTFDDLKKEGLIPENYDISNPQHNKIAGDTLIDKYAKMYNNNPDKIAAAYYGGTGAINKDGSINYDWRDTKNPKAPTVGEYISQVKERAQLTSAPADTARLSGRGKTVPELLLEQEIYKKRGEAEATKTGEDIALYRAATVKAHETADSRVQYADRLNNLITSNPKTFGILANANFASGFGAMLQGGIQAGTSGSVGLKDLDKFVRQSMNDSGVYAEQDIVAAQKAMTIFARLALDEAQIVLKGQGAVSNMERQLVEESVSSIGSKPEAIKDFLTYSKMRAQYDKQIGEQYNRFQKAYPDASFNKFMLSDEYANTKAAYKTKVEAYIQSSHLNDMIASGKAPAAPAPKWNHTDAEFKAYKKARGLE